MIADEYVDALRTPKCPICGAEMLAHHAQHWTGMRYITLSIRFDCHGPDRMAEGAHTLSLVALSAGQWDATAKLMRLEYAG